MSGERDGWSWCYASLEIAKKINIYERQREKER
jgi:hypothetical protein